MPDPFLYCYVFVFMVGCGIVLQIHSDRSVRVVPIFRFFKYWFSLFSFFILFFIYLFVRSANGVGFCVCLVTKLFSV